MKKQLLLFVRITAFYFTFIQPTYAQPAGNLGDTIPARTLDSIIISSSVRLNHTPYLNAVEGINLYSGKKTNALLPDPSKANLAANISRMIFAQVPGITLWDMSGSGTQMNIGTRGTDAHRSIEMNMRQNGYNINSDVFGYPEAHYTPPMQAVQKIELVRGSAALAFGPQFGGMLNYILKEADTSRKFSLESEQTVGSNNFFNAFNSVAGRKNRISYYAYYDYRNGDGWRPNAAFTYHAYHANISYQFPGRGNLSFQFSGMQYREQIAGGLTDAQFNKDARQSLRARNFFSPIINIPALILNYRLAPQTFVKITAHYLGGQRNSVQFLNPPTISDTVNTSLGTYNPRQVDRDYYSGFTTEARLLQRYSLHKTKGVLSGGVRYFEQTTRRKQKGLGTTASDFDLSLVKPYGIDLNLHTFNVAAFAENMFQLSDRFSVTPGIRMELIKTRMTGVINNAQDPVRYLSTRHFPLFGTGFQFQTSRSAELYGNISQAYRPYLYANVTPADRIDIVDPNLKDSKGYDIDLGYRGHLNDIVKWDINGFYLYYGNRVGQLTKTNETGGSYLFTTNIGNAVSRGFESYISVAFARLLLPQYTGNALYKLRIFNSLSYTDARYQGGEVNRGGQNISLKGNRLEGVAQWTSRTGLAWQHKTFIAQIAFSYVGKTYSDATNSTFSETGATGIVPAYHVWDLSIHWKFLKNYNLSTGINNLGNEKYFTRRINMYPGPGILPADGRSFYFSLGLRI